MALFHYFLDAFFFFLIIVYARGFAKGQQNGAGYEYGGISANYNASQHGEGKVVNNGPAQEKEGQKHHDGCARGEDSAA